MDLKEIYQETTNKMQQTFELLQHELVGVRTGRASPALVEGIKVESYGTIIPLKQVASVACPEPKLIVIRPWDKTLVPAIEKAILKSDLGLTPSNDGVAVRLPLPPLTEERRKGLIKIVGRMLEDSKIAIRNLRRDAIAKLKEMDSIPEDDKHRGEKEIQRITDDFMKKMDEIFARKEKEIMEVGS